MYVFVYFYIFEQKRAQRKETDTDQGERLQCHWASFCDFLGKDQLVADLFRAFIVGIDEEKTHVLDEEPRESEEPGHNPGHRGFLLGEIFGHEQDREDVEATVGRSYSDTEKYDKKIEVRGTASKEKK